MDDEETLSTPSYEDDCDNGCDKLENMESPPSSDQHSGDEEENNSSVPTPPAPKRSTSIKNKRRGRRRGRKKVFNNDYEVEEEEEEEEEEEDEEEKNCRREDRASENENEFNTEVNDRLHEGANIGGELEVDSGDQSTRRVLRKSTTSTRDLLLYREGNPFLEDSIDNDDMNEEPELPPKRRRKKARPRNASLDSDSSDSQPSDLELGYKILEQMMAFPRAAPFLDRPDENVYGMKDYYKVIAKPMWLMEIDRKYLEDEYKTVTELMKDIRQILENCYSYWGSGDPLTKKALVVEEFLEKKISLLPSSVKQLCTLEATHGEDDNEDEIEENSSKDEDQSQIPENKRYCQMIKKGNFESKLLQRVTKSISGKSDSLAVSPFLRCTEQEEIEKDVEDWENRVLLVGDVVKQIEAMWELPVIGHFFYLTFNVLNVEPVSQLELERMLLMPQASIMLAKVMTSMLIPPLSRAKLEVGPPMPYSIWTARLKTKVTSWYRIYRATGDQTLKVFEQIGVEPEFWLVMGESNPFSDCEFHELSFLQRVWLLKSLCDFLLHNHKRIQDVINKIEPDELREKCLGTDKLGNTYHYFPEFSVVRIYKQAKVADSKWHGFEAGVEEMISVAAEDIESDSEEGSQEQNAAGIKKLFYKTPKRMIPSANNFKLVASSVEDIRCLIDNFCSSDQQVVQGRGALVPLVYRLNAIITELQPIEKKLICSITYIRNKMYKEWTDYKNRDADYVDPGISYWERREKDHSEKEEKQSTIEVGESTAATSNEPSGTGERRERRSKREHQMRFTDFDGLDADEDDEELYYEEEDDSEDEWVACPSKKKKKQQNVKQKMKKLNSLSEQIKSQPEQEQAIGKSVNNQMIFNANMEMIKPENIKTEKPDTVRIKSETDLNFSAEQQMVCVKQEPGSSYSPPIKQELHVPSQTVVRTLVKLTTPVQQQCASVPIKKSKSPEPEIICISDEDPDSPPDVKPIIDDLHSIKTVDCVVPLVDQRIGPRPPYHPGQNLQNQFSGQYLNSGNSNPVYVNSMTSQVPPPTYLNNPQVRASPQPQQVMPTVRSPHNQGVMYRPNSATPIKQSPQSFANSSPKNTVQPGNKQNYFTNVQNNKQFSPSNNNNNNRSFVNSSGSPQMNKSPRQSFQSPSVQTQRSPRPGNAPIMQTLLSSSPGRGRPRGPQSIRMPSPRVGTSSVRQMSPQQQMNNKGMINSPRSVLRQRSPQTAGQRNVIVQRSPSGGSYNSPIVNNRPQQQSNKVITPPPPARRNLNFNSPNRQQMAPPPQEPPLQIINTGGIISKNATTVEGKLLVGLTDDGNYGYHVVLPDGGKVTLTTSQLAELRAKNGGSLPQKVGVPMVQSSD